MSHCKKQMISFFLTTKCNLCCRYCYNAKERNAIEEQSIPIEIAKAGIDWYFSTNESRHIRFYGPGEPTQEFEKLKEITEYAKSHYTRGEDVTVEIQTNGVFTKDVRNWALNNINIIWMSFDGMKDIQDYNRPLNPKYKATFGNSTSSEVLESNVKWMIENKGNRNLMVGARVTITDINVDKQIEMVDYFYSLGIRHVWTDPEFYSVGKKPACSDAPRQKNYHFDMDAYLSNYLKAYYYAKEKGLFWGSFFIINFDGESDYHCRCCNPLNAPHLTTDGYISACDMALIGTTPNHMAPFIVGKWNDKNKSFDWNYTRIKALNERKSTNIKHCLKCPIQLHCGGYCLGETVNETGSLNGENKTKCNAIQYLFSKLGVLPPFDYLHP